MEIAKTFINSQLYIFYPFTDVVGVGAFVLGNKLKCLSFSLSELCVFFISNLQYQGFTKMNNFFLTKSPQIFDVFKIGSYMFQLSHNYVSLL